MSMISMYLQQLEQESITTHKMLALIPDEKFYWQPHPKSMTLRQLGTHIAELPTWITFGLTTDELDFAKTPYQPKEINNTAELLAYFEESLADGRTHLIPENESKLAESWKLRAGERIFLDISKGEAIRNSLSQTIHHRAQLGVFLRLLDIPIPGSYGPSADEMQS